MTLCTTASGSRPYFGPQQAQHVELLVGVQRFEDVECEVLHLRHLGGVDSLTTWRIDRMPKAAWRDSSICTRRIMSRSSGFVVSLRDGVEDADRHALEQRLHAQRLHLPRRRLEQHVEQDLERRVDRMDGADLALQELREHLDVAHLVDHLRAGVELRVHRRARIGELPAQLQRRLLAVQELGEQVRELVERGAPAGLVVDAHHS